jgi:hypothetical protein
MIVKGTYLVWGYKVTSIIYIIKELVPGKSKSKKRKTHNSNILGGNFLEDLTESHLHESSLTEKRVRERESEIRERE